MHKKNPWLAALLNFFLLGAGYIYNGKRKMLGVGLTAGALLTTWVELKIKEVQPDLYLYAFISFLILAVFLAIDGYQEAKQISKNTHNDQRPTPQI